MTIPIPNRARSANTPTNQSANSTRHRSRGLGADSVAVCAGSRAEANETRGCVTGAGVVLAGDCSRVSVGAGAIVGNTFSWKGAYAMSAGIASNPPTPRVQRRWRSAAEFRRSRYAATATSARRIVVLMRAFVANVSMATVPPYARSGSSVSAARWRRAALWYRSSRAAPPSPLRSSH